MQESPPPTTTGHSDNDDSSASSDNSSDNRYWVLLALVGLFLGMSATASYLVTDYSSWWAPEKNVSVTADNESEDVNIDVNNPDYSRIHEWYRQGRADQVITALQTIKEESNTRSARAKALYYQYVFFQGQEQYQQAIEAADEFIESYPRHALRPEVLYGTGLICEEYVDSECDTDYYEILKQDHPESKWSNEISSSS